VTLVRRVYDAQSAFRAALCDSFNTSVALDVLRELVSFVNVYINDKGKNANPQVVGYAAGWVGRMLRMFGLGEGNDRELGWGQATSEEAHVNVCLLLLTSIDFHLTAFDAYSVKKFSCLTFMCFHHSGTVSERLR
jgi:cysteinyl-tRNA synthetase